MQEEHLIVGGYLSRVVFGRTFVVLEGFSSPDDEPVEWWLRLGKGFYVSSLNNNSKSQLLDVSDALLTPAATLIDSCGNLVSQFNVSPLTMNMQIGATKIEMVWALGEIGCAELDIRRTGSNGHVEESFGIAIPEDLGIRD